MTSEEICAIVCTCLAEITIRPDNMTQAQCEEQPTKELGLSDEDISSLLACIEGKLHEQQCLAVIGPSDWKRAKTVGEFCGFVYKKHTCA
jgi:hypothetical protein